MGRNNGNPKKGGKGSSVPNTDVFHRMNFLQAAGMLMTALSTQPRSLTETARARYPALPTPPSAAAATDPLAKGEGEGEPQLPGGADSEAQQDTRAASCCKPEGENELKETTTGPSAPAPAPAPASVLTLPSTSNSGGGSGVEGTDLTPLARFYGNTIRRIGKRTVVRW
ncbi:hypothetical protein BJ085DRAFT_39090 [Dimargaris cristalligena]|uniref:Uncharacterized protein n=1 Tax=Dimargaris cristalligena TaxID=215637 RepID=A0A4Q0A0V5_9FUNG|nr:hypothetical protein BJ085DRAFT_39090 [Dimargaris cristalligena]|eukprot:RKP39644.1 hypothetical protein BJ085DRAFT_39090 [Dimargaris cristalligena]